MEKKDHYAAGSWRHTDGRDAEAKPEHKPNRHERRKAAALRRRKKGKR